MEVKFLKAGKGDSILISNDSKHMLIDGGDDSTYMLEELDQIFNNKECLDHIIITHHDSDHIKGIIDLFEALKHGRFGTPSKFIGKIYFNSPRIIKNMLTQEASNKLSYRQAFILHNEINELDLEYTHLIDSSPNISLGDAQIRCLSPTQEILTRYKEKTPEKYLANYTGGDWKKSFKELDPYISDDSKDRSFANLTSIVLLIQNKNKKGILTGDVTPGRLEIISEFLFKENDNCKIDFDFLKLPHHGSHRSITKKIMSNFNSTNYIISTNGKNNFLPNKKAFLKVLKYSTQNRDTLHFSFNYPDLVEKLNFTEAEMNEYNFTINTNYFNNGICI